MTRAKGIPPRPIGRPRNPDWRLGIQLLPVSQWTSSDHFAARVLGITGKERKPITAGQTSAGVETGEHVSALRPGAEEGVTPSRLPGDRSQGRGTKEARQRVNAAGHETPDKEAS